ncbi:MAG: XRE family transcriptional regulator [Candidatus Eremiobacteraeota bacterium]|nr:XRE family transcriptional regulator [Candidatus Eremiobacteraeota bacterium]
MMKTTPWSEIRKNSKLSAERLAEIKSAAKIESAQIARAMKIDQLRRARRLTQQELAEKLGTNQGAVSRMEKQTDLYVGTLARFVHALGGRLNITVQFDGASLPIELEMFGDIGGPPRSKKRAAAARQKPKKQEAMSA